MKYAVRIVIVVLGLVGAVIIAANPGAQAVQTARSAIALSPDALAIVAAAEVDKEKMCLNGRPLGGCCSGHGGIDEIVGPTVWCNDGTYSQSCSTHLTGCCSNKGGIDEVLDDGTVMCGDETPSPSCQCDRRT